MPAKSLQLYLSLYSTMDYGPQGSSVHGIRHALLRGIFLTWGSNLHLLCLLHWQAGSLPLAPPGKPVLLNGIEIQKRGDMCICIADSLVTQTVYVK